MGKYLITTGDFLKNAGIVGLYYINLMLLKAGSTV